jgi:hypothetical protein
MPRVLAITVMILAAAVRSVDAQSPTIRYYVVPPATVRLLQDSRIDSVSRVARAIVGRASSGRVMIVMRDTVALRDCPMPVAIPDTTRLTPMPVFATPSQRTASMPSASVGCRNPLFRP